MRSARPLMRLLAAILRVVALVVMLPVLAQAHAVHDHAQVGQGIGVAGAHSAEAVSQAPAAITATDACDRSDCLGCQSCCCGHVFVASAEHGAVRGDRPNGRRVAMGPDFARPSALAETLPEPPRPFA